MVEWAIIFAGLLFSIGVLIAGEYIKRMMIDKKPYRWVVFSIYTFATLGLFTAVLSWMNK